MQKQPTASAQRQNKGGKMKKIFVLLTLIALPLILLFPALAEEVYTGIGNASSLITIGVLLIAMFIALAVSARRIKWNASMIAKAAICIALAYVFSIIKVFRMPMGGSVTLVSMLPLILFTVAFGPLEGVLIGCVYGLLQLLIDPYVIHPMQLLVDYPMAFAAVTLSCAASLLPLPKRAGLPVAVLLGYLGRCIMAVISGVVFFAEYAGEQGAFLYSLIYNLSYLGPEALLCMAVALVPGMHRLPPLLAENAKR